MLQKGALLPQKCLGTVLLWVLHGRHESKKLISCNCFQESTIKSTIFKRNTELSGRRSLVYLNFELDKASFALPPNLLCNDACTVQRTI